MRQRLSNPGLKWWQGLLLIAGIVAMLTVFQFFAAVASLMIGGDNAFAVASIAFWIFGGVIALQLLRAFIMEYEYLLEGISFSISRIYSGLRPREALSIVTRSIRAVGTPEEIEGKYPGSHPMVYTRSRSGLEVMAVAYMADDKIKVIHIQPDDMLRERLISCVKK